jgi:hypothetical protein
MTIQGKVAAILNERELVINLGEISGVQEGMRFKVMSHELDIVDPDSQEQLGVFAREKVRVKVVEVHPKYSVGSTYETYQVAQGSGLPDFSHLFERSRKVTRVRTLRADNAVFLEPLDEMNSIVKIGDPVFQVEDSV